MVQNSSDDRINNILHSFGLPVESRVGGQDRGTGQQQ
jgi:hypothetical protein